MNRELLIAYTFGYLGCLFSQSRIKNMPIKSIFLFGSVARGDFDKDSDIDIFFDVEDKYAETIESIIKASEKNFYSSESNKKFLFLGIKNEIKPMVGDLQKWELKESVEKDSIVLFSSSFSSGLKKHFLITIKPIKDIKERNAVFRKLVGRKEKYYKGGGLVKEIGGQQLDKRGFIVPAEKVNSVLNIFSKKKVDYFLEPVWK